MLKGRMTSILVGLVLLNALGMTALVTTWLKTARGLRSLQNQTERHNLFVSQQKRWLKGLSTAAFQYGQTNKAILPILEPYISVSVTTTKAE